MKFDTHFTPLAHAYVVVGDAGVVEQELVSILENDHSVSPHGNPDFWLKRFGTLTVGDTREIIEAASRRKVTEGKRVFIINAETMTREASNTLLKTLEEPAEGTHFFIILPSAKRVLPTIVSRVRLVSHPSIQTSAISQAEEFVALSVGERMTYIKELLGKLDKEELPRTHIISFIEYVVRSMQNKKPSPHAVSIASYATDQSASLKMILEYLALN